MRRTRALVCVLVAASLGASPASAELLQVQVNRAIDRGVARVLGSQKADGTFPVRDLHEYPGGTTALALYALIKSGVDPDEPQVQKALAAMERAPLVKTYDAATRVLALDAFRDRRHDARIRALADWIVARFLAEARLWDYPGLHADLSNTQFAVLGLWAAERHGHKTPVKVWSALLESVPRHQRGNGGFAYTTSKDHRESGGMTTAAITILELALQRVPPAVRKSRAWADANAALERGWEYLDRRYVGLEHPIMTHAFHRWFDEYYLYGVERVAALTDRSEIGGGDWYVEGAKDLIAAQREDGGWGRLDATCFALLFLRRATFTTMERKVTPVTGDGVAREAPSAFVKPADDVPFIRRWLVLGPFDDPDDLLLHDAIIREERAAPSARGTQAGRRWSEYRSGGNFVDLRDAVGSGDRQIVYAFTYLHAAKDVDAVLWAGHDDACRIWIDGKLVHDFHYHEFPGHDSYAFPITLTAGTHRVLFKVENWYGGHGLYARVADREGQWPRGVLPSLDAADPQRTANAIAHPELLSLAALLEQLPLERSREEKFNSARALRRIAMTSQYGHYPYWVGEPQAPHARDEPNPGAFGSLAIHAPGPGSACRVFRKVHVPDGGGVFRVRASGSAYRGADADAIVRIGVFAGELHWLAEEIVAGLPRPDPSGWRVLQADLREHAGRDVLLIVEAADGGRRSWYIESVFLDEMSLIVE